MVESLRSLIVEAWNGQRPLWKTFWLYHVGGVFLVVGILIGIMSLASLMPSVTGLVLIFGAVGFLLAWKVWALVSIWRCAGNSSGSIPKFLAKGYVVLFVLYVPLSFYDNIGKFTEYRQRGYDAVVKAQIRNAAVAEEAFFARSKRYTNQAADLYGQYLQADPQVRLAPVIASDGSPKFVIVGRHTATEKAFFFDSSTGVITETTVKEIRETGLKGID